LEFLVCPLYTFIIPHFRWLVKGFCEKILFFFAPLWVRFVSHIIPYYFNLLGHWFTFIYRKYEHLAVESLCRVGLTRSPCDLTLRVAFPLSVYIIAYFVGFVKGFFKSFLKKFVSRMVGSTQLPRTVRPPEGSQLLGGSLPLTSIVYHRPPQKSTGNVAQIAGNLTIYFYSLCLLTKLLGLWYNKNSRPGQPWPRD
jgi:hypothetical protein